MVKKSLQLFTIFKLFILKYSNVTCTIYFDDRLFTIMETNQNSKVAEAYSMKITALVAMKRGTEIDQLC